MSEMPEDVRKMLHAAFPEPKEAKAKAKVRNVKTGAVREVARPGLKALERDFRDGTSPCVGPCKCKVETDGTCPNGWPSRFLAFGI